MVHPIAQTSDEMIRECLGSIARVAKDVEDAAMQQDLPGLDIHYNFLVTQMKRLKVIERGIMVKRRNL